MAITRRALLISTAIPFLTRSVRAASDVEAGQSRSRIFVGDRWMETPDILAFTVDDIPARLGNIYDTGTTQMKPYDVWFRATNPRDGREFENALVISGNKQFIKFNDLPSLGFVDRLALRDPKHYSITNGLRVISVYFRQEENNQIGQGGGHVGNQFSITQTITVYLKLSSAPSQGTTYRITHATNAFNSFNFTFNDKKTRAGGIRVSAGGHKPNDPLKYAYLCSRIPGAPNHGVIDFKSDYGIRSFQILDGSGVSVFEGPIVLRALWSDVEKPVAFTASISGNILTVTSIASGQITAGMEVRGNGVAANTKISSLKTGRGGKGTYGVSITQNVASRAMWGPDAYPTNIDIADMSESWTISGVTTGRTHTVIQFAGGHRFSVGDKVRFRGISGMTQLEGGPGTAHAWIAPTVIAADAKTITIALNSSRFSDLTTGTYSTSLGGYENQAYKTFNANRAGTTVYGLDYSAFTPKLPEEYFIYIPGFGISDPIPIRRNQFATNASLHHQGIYNLRLGIPVNLSPGYNRGIALKDGVSPTNNYWSDLPALWASESGTVNFGDKTQSGSGAYLCNMRFGSRSYVAFGTTRRAVGSRPGHQDASDNDDLAIDHAPHWANLAWIFEALSPASRVTPFKVPLSSTVCDPKIFAGTDGAPPIFHEIVWWAESLRTMQNREKSDTTLFGSVPGGYGIGHFSQQTPNAGEPISYYRGTDPNNLKDGGICGAFLYAPDHLSGLYIAWVFAKLAIICEDYGFAAAKTAYETAAIDLLVWCEGIALNASTRDSYYVTHLGFLEKMSHQFGWTRAIYERNMASVLKTYNDVRPNVFATMWRLTKDWPSYGRIADASFSALPATQGGWDFLQMAGDAHYSALRGNYIKNHWYDSYKRAIAARSISGSTSFMTNNLGYLGGIYPSLTNVIAHMMDVFQNDKPDRSISLMAIESNFIFQYGGNLRGRQYCTGQAPRPTTLVDHLDSWKLGGPSPVGITPFSFAPSGWGTYTLGAFFAFDLGRAADGPLVWPASNTTGSFESSPIYGSKKVHEPWPQGQAQWEFSPQNNALIGICEYTLGSLLDTLVAALWLHGWDGSHI